jgi:hypothetical protein
MGAGALVVTSVYPHAFLSGEVLYKHNPFQNDRDRADLIERLYAIPQVIRTELDVYPHIPLQALADEGTWDSFFDVMSWVLAKLRRAAELGLK